MPRGSTRHLPEREVLVNAYRGTHINELRPCPYVLILTEDKSAAISTVGRLQPQAFRTGSIFVLQGEVARREEMFPTRQMMNRIRHFRAKALEAPDQAMEIAIVFYRFYPVRTGLEEAVAMCRLLLKAEGYSEENVRIVAVATDDQFAAVMGKLLPGEPGLTVEPGSFLEAIEIAASEYEDSLVFSARARQSAAVWDYPNPSKILSDVQAVHRVYGLWQTATGEAITAQARKQVLLAEAGLNLKGESDSVTKKHRKAVFPEMNNRELLYPLHLAYSYRDTRIHFWFPAPAGRAAEKVKTLIAHAGEHLYNGNWTKSNSG